MRTHLILLSVTIVLGALACVRPASDVDAAREMLDSARSELDQTRRQLDAAREMLDSTRSELDQTRRQLDSTRSELDQTTYQLDQTDARTRHAQTRKLEVIDALSGLMALYTGQSTLGDVQKIVRYLSDDCLSHWDAAFDAVRAGRTTSTARDRLFVCILDESVTWLQ